MTPIRSSVSLKLGRELSDALGLKNVRRLVLTLDVDAAPVVEATFFADEDAGRDVPLIMKRYTLVERSIDPTLADVLSVLSAECDADCPNRETAWPSCCKVAKQEAP